MHRPENPPFLKKKSGCLTLVGWWRHWLTCLAALAHGSLVSSSANQTGYTTNPQSCPKAFLKKAIAPSHCTLAEGRHLPFFWPYSKSKHMRLIYFVCGTTTSTIFLVILHAYSKVQTRVSFMIRDKLILTFTHLSKDIITLPTTEITGGDLRPLSIFIFFI